MVFIRNISLVCCLQILATIVMPINCNAFDSKINQSRYPRQVNANNNQPIGANDNVVSDEKPTSQSAFALLNRDVKDLMSHMYNSRVILPGQTDGRRGRQLNSSIYPQTQVYGYEDYKSQPWYAANREYYDKYFENYYLNYYQTTTEPMATGHQYQQSFHSQVSQSNPQSILNRQNSVNSPLSTLLPETNQNNDGPSIYIDENGIFQISRSNAANVVDGMSSVIDDDAIVFQGDESEFNQRNQFVIDGNTKPSQSDNSNTFNGLPIFSD